MKTVVRHTRSNLKLESERIARAAFLEHSLRSKKSGKEYIVRGVPHSFKLDGQKLWKK